MTRINGPRVAPPATSPTPAKTQAPASDAPPAAAGWKPAPRTSAPATGQGEARFDHSQAAADAQAVYAALNPGLTGLGTDESGLFSLLANREPAQLNDVKRLYQEQYGTSLEGALKKDLSGGDLRRATALLGGDVVQAQAERLHNATRGVFGANSQELIHALEAMPPEQAAAVKQRFAEHFGPLEGALSRSLAGPSRDEALALLSGDRVAASAARLDGALNLTHSPDVALQVLSHAPPEALAQLSQAYQQRTGRPLAADAGARLKGTQKDLAAALLAGDAVGADVARLRHAAEGKLFGLGKDATGAMAILEGQPAAQRPVLAAAYEKKYGVGLAADIAARYGGREGERLQQALAGTLDPVERVQIALKGWGADQKAIHQVLDGRSKEQIAQLSADYKARTGEELPAALGRELSGRAKFDAMLSLEGAPATPEEAIDRTRRQRDFERSGGWNQISRFAMDRVSGSGARLDDTVKQAQAALTAARADGVIDEGERAHLAELTGRAAGEVKTYREKKDATAQGAATAAAVAATVATAGAGAPLLVGAAAGAAAKVATTAALSGQGYSKEQAGLDAAKGVLEGLGGVAGGAVVGKAAATIAGRAAQGAVSGAVTGFVQGAAENALDSQTWNAGVKEGLFQVGKQAASSAATSAAMGAAGSVAKDLRGPPTAQSNVVATKLPGEGEVDLSKYKADKAARDGTKKLLGYEYVETQFAAEDAKAANKALGKAQVGDLIGLRAYTADHYKEMNAALRGGKPADLKKVAPMVKTAASALNTLPTYEGTVYRGTHLDPAALKQYQVGKVVAEKAFMSTTTVKGTAFQGNAVFVIKSKAGGKAVDMLSKFPTEKEVLFGPGTEFKVLKNALDAKTGKQLIYLQEVP